LSQCTWHDIDPGNIFLDFSYWKIMI
jgi:hypothetical protein